MTQPARRYYRVMLGRHSAHMPECLAGGFIAADFVSEQNLSGKRPEDKH